MVLIIDTKMKQFQRKKKNVWKESEMKGQVKK